MKRNLLLLISITALLSCNVLKAQTYFPFPTTTASWTYRYWDDLGFPTNTFWNFFMEGDTVFNSLQYNKIYFVNNPPYYIGATRESNKVVYLWARDSLQEYILYDFNAQLGDTLPSSVWGATNCSPIICYGYDSVLLTNGYHQVQHFNFEATIEGIGFQYGTGVIGPLYCAIVSGYFHLECFSDSTNTIIFGSSPFGGQGCAPLGIKENNISHNIFVSPNPVNKTLSLYLNKDVNILIVNLLGEVVLQKNFSNDTDKKIELDVSFLSAGIYFIKAGNEVRKFVKE